MSRYRKRIGGPGKGWARGLTAATDARIARGAAKHLGMTYQRRTPVELCRWAKPRASVAPEWTAKTAYLVGLIATDGCLIDYKGTRRIDFVTAEIEMAETYARLIGVPGRLRASRSKDGRTAYRVSFKHAGFYRWLIAIGLTPRKSLTLGPIDVPREHLSHFVRGLMDGDGSVQNYYSRADTTRKPKGNYRYDWLRTKFVSASQKHLIWLQSLLRQQPGVRGGWIHETINEDGRRCSALAFGRYDSMLLLAWLYSSPELPCLQRKRAVWSAYVTRHEGEVPSGAGRWRGTPGRYGRSGRARAHDPTSEQQDERAG